MPMDFPDIDSLKWCAKGHGFREPNEGESENEYRGALANHVEPRDFIEAQEIRNKVGWDKWNEKQQQELVARRMGCDTDD